MGPWAGSLRFFEAARVMSAPLSQDEPVVRLSGAGDGRRSFLPQGEPTQERAENILNSKCNLTVSNLNSAIAWLLEFPERQRGLQILRF